MQKKSVPAESVAESFLARLRDGGISRLFVNGGTDFASIVEAYARAEVSGLDFPAVVVCPHENMAVSMAHGSYLGDGQAQAVMLHTSVGTANALCGVLNASRARIPMMVTAGRTPLFEHSVFGARNGGIHWAQEMYDQAGMLRELVKWEYELRDGVQVEEVVDRSLDIARTEPCGPVYLTLPREVLARPAGQASVGNPPPAIPTDPFPTPEAVATLADRLADAHFPVFITSTSGADQRTVPLLEELCSRFAIGVGESGARYMNVSSAHPLYLGSDLRSLVQDMDTLCSLDVDVPWAQQSWIPRSDAFVAQCGPDPHFTRYPIRSHRSDLSVTSTSYQLLKALTQALAEREGRIDASRRERIESVARERRAQRRAALDAESELDGRITKPFMNWALNQIRPPDAVIVNETWAQLALLDGLEPGNYFGPPPAGGLGWGLPAALGMQLARPDRTVIATLGDGAYMFANPAACHQGMAMQDLPVLLIICTNQRWAAVQSSAVGMYPEGHAASAPEVSPLARLDPVPAFEKYAEASGGYGEHVVERAQLVPALRRALNVVRSEHRHALVNVECA